MEDNNKIEEGQKHELIEETSHQEAPKGKAETGEKTVVEQVGTVVTKNLERSMNKATKDGKADERVVANPDLSFSPESLKKKGKAEEAVETSGLSKNEQKPSISGTERKGQSEQVEISGLSPNQQKKDVSETEKSQEPEIKEEATEAINTHKPTKKPVEKTDEEELHGQGHGEKPEEKLEEIGSEEIRDGLGSGKEMRNLDKVAIDRNIGVQDRELLPNGQQIVTLDIDKAEWLKATPDKDGNLHVSLNHHENENDKFNNTLLKVPVSKVKMMEPDENGRIKLMVAEEKPGHRNSAIQVHVDNAENRQKLVNQRPNLLSDTPALEKERVMNKPLNHGFYGYEMPLSMKDIHGQMKPDNQAVINKMPVQNLKEFIKDPETMEKYTMYEDMYQNRKESAIRKGMEVEVPGETIGRNGEQATVKFKENIKGVGEKVVDENGKEHIMDSKDLDKGVPSRANDEKLKLEVIKDVSEAIERTPMQKIVDRAAKTVLGEEGETMLKNTRLTDKYPVNSYNVKEDDVTKFREKVESFKQTTKEVNVTEKVDENAKKEEALKTPVSDKRNYKEYVDNMSIDTQADIKNKSSEDIKAEAQKNAPELRKNEQNVAEGTTIKKDGDKVDKLSVNEQFSKAIVNNDKKEVKHLLEEGHKPGENHVKLMKEMKQENVQLDKSIEKSITAAVPSNQQSVKV